MALAAILDGHLQQFEAASDLVDADDTGPLRRPGPLRVEHVSVLRPGRTVPALDSALAERDAGKDAGRVWLIVTFERALQMDLPELNARVRSGWTMQQAFDGTVGDGGISVWREAGRAGATP